MALGHLDTERGNGQLTFPVFGNSEDLIAAILRPHFERLIEMGGPRVHLYFDYATDMLTPAVIVLNTRRTGIEAYETQADEHVRSAILEVLTIAEGLNAEKDAADLQESVRHALLDAWRRQIVIPNYGVINKVTTPTFATRQTDWASASGPVQYAKLPHGASRYEARYRLLIRPSLTYDNQFLPYNGHNL